MNVSKLFFLLALLLFSVELPLLRSLFGSLPLFPDRDGSAGPIICLLVIGVLISSYILKNKTAKRLLENASLILSALCYRLLAGADLLKDIPLVVQFLFLGSFGFFLYFKMNVYFDRKNSVDEHH